jgi:hypothetical protein
MMMSTNVLRLTTSTGKTQWMITIGSTTYFRTNWDDVIDILKDAEDNESVESRGYGNRVYSGD